MREPIPAPPSSFSLTPHGGRWYRWLEVARCFWPRGYGAATSAQVDPVLAAVKDEGGVYVFALSKKEPATTQPDDQSVVYVGESNWFKRRMEDFGNSAGLWGTRARGHSAGWRYTGSGNDLWVAFFVVPWPLGQAHLAEGLRKWLEAVALEEHRQKHGALPLLNEGEAEEVE